jgi:predicted nuclease of predicted toxin-antitoxin system
MRFLANMGISPLTVVFLRTQGHDAVHLHEQGLDRHPDPDILDKARREERILLTSDLDFADLLAHRQASCPA